MIHPFLDTEAYRKRFEGNINESVETHVLEGYRPDVDFFTEYKPRLLKSALFKGMDGIIEHLAETTMLVIISSTTTDLIKKFLALHKLDHFFKEILGNDVHESKIKKIEMIIEKYNVDPEKSFFITDTLGDIKEAHHFGIKTVAVSWGYQSKETLQRGKPFVVVDSPEELVGVFI